MYDFSISKSEGSLNDSIGDFETFTLNKYFRLFFTVTPTRGNVDNFEGPVAADEEFSDPNGFRNVTNGVNFRYFSEERGSLNYNNWPQIIAITSDTEFIPADAEDDEAENRLHAQKALLVWLLDKSTS